MNYLPEMLFIQMGGIYPTDSKNSVDWYLSAMIIAGLFIYYSYANYRKQFLNLIAPAIIITAYGYLFHAAGTVDNYWSYCAVGQFGLLRAFAGLSLGCISYKLNNALIDREHSSVKCQIESAVLFASVIVMGALYSHTAYDYIEIAALFFAVTLAFIPFRVNEYTGRVLQLVSGWTLPMYLLHMFVISIFRKILGAEMWRLGWVLLCIMITIIISAAAKVIIDFGWGKVKRGLIRLLL